MVALGYLGIHLFWMASAPRYFLVLLPLTSILWMIGSRGRSWIPQIVLAALLGLYEWQDLNAWRESRRPPQENRLPAKAFAFLGTHATPATVVYTFNQYAVFLHTGLPAISAVAAQSPEALYAKAREHGITDILLVASRVMFMRLSAGLDSTCGWPRQEQWVRTCPDLFEKVFENAGEGTQVYRLRPDDHFAQAYALASQASGGYRSRPSP